MKEPRNYLDLRKRAVPRPAAAAPACGKDSAHAPEAVAAGFGLRAEQIAELARARGVPLYEDPALVEALGRLEIGSAVPSELWEVVATVLAFIYRVDAAAASEPGAH
jgi:flagellar biosynthesis protein